MSHLNKITYFLNIYYHPRNLTYKISFNSNSTSDSNTVSGLYLFFLVTGVIIFTLNHILLGKMHDT